MLPSRALASPSAPLPTTSSVDLDRVLSILSSDQFRCPGQRWQEYDYVNEDDPQPPVAYGGWARRYGPLRGSYDDRGYCTNMLEASVEHEYGDFGAILSTYIGFDGPCAEYHAVNDDGWPYQMLAEHYSERKQLLRAVRQALVER